MIVRVQKAVPGPVTPVGVDYLLGRATARFGNLSSQSALPPPAGPIESSPAPDTGVTPDSGPGPSLTEDRPPTPKTSVVSPSIPVPGGAVSVPAPVPLSPPQLALVAPSPPALVARPAGATNPTGLFDTTDLYLLVAFGGLLASAFVRLMTKTRKVTS